MLGLPDMVTALSFDNAVMAFGVWVENRLNELDEQRRPKYTLDDLLEIEPELPPISDEELPEWGAPIPESFRQRVRRRNNQAGERFLRLLSKEA